MEEAPGEDELGGVSVMQNAECRRQKPRTRLEQIRCMSLEELAQRLLTLNERDTGSYCVKNECYEALKDESLYKAITTADCLECVKAWLMEEV